LCINDGRIELENQFNNWGSSTRCRPMKNSPFILFGRRRKEKRKKKKERTNKKK
jgi:hypothetical protein